MQDTIIVPPCDPAGCFSDERGRLADHPTGLAGPDPVPAAAAIRSVLRFGAILPPLSPWEGVGRLIPGSAYRGARCEGPVPLEDPATDAGSAAGSTTDLAVAVLDGILRRHLGDRRDPVLLFSGGVDSGLLAARLAALGYRDSLLVHFSFGADDPATPNARAMADHLGLRCETVHARGRLTDCLTAPGAVYPMPFGDQGTPHTWDLARSVNERLEGRSRIVLDGTGADGVFGLANRVGDWQKVTSLPGGLRRWAAQMYRARFWYRNGRVERLLRVLGRTADVSPVVALVAQNALAGTFYQLPDEPDLDGLLVDWLEGWAGPDPARGMVAADLALLCSGVTSRKADAILRASGHEMLYPFLDTAMVSLAFRLLPLLRGQEPKAPIREALARQVPRTMLRPKLGFIHPRRPVFHEPAFLDYLEQSTGDESVMAGLVEPAPLRRALDLLRAGRMLPPQTLNLLWAVTFTDRWYRTVPTGSGS